MSAKGSPWYPGPNKCQCSLHATWCATTVVYCRLSRTYACLGWKNLETGCRRRGCRGQARGGGGGRICFTGWTNNYTILDDAKHVLYSVLKWQDGGLVEKHFKYLPVQCSVANREMDGLEYKVRVQRAHIPWCILENKTKTEQKQLQHEHWTDRHGQLAYTSSERAENHNVTCRVK